MGCTLDQVADARLCLERSRIFPNQAGFRLLDPLLRRHGHFAARAVTATVESFRLKNVVLDAREGALTRDGVLIADTCFFVTPGDQADPDPAGIVHLPDGFDYILCYNKLAYAYHHWLIQCLPAIDWGLRLHGDRHPVLVLPPLAPWQQQMIDLLGFGQVQRLTVESGKFYAFPQIDYAGYLNGTSSFGIVTSVYETARRILDGLPPAMPRQTARSQILYVPCSIPHYGRLANETAVIDLLRHLGVTILDLSLDTAARLDLVRKADVIIGPHGTNLADILFMRPGSLLWEWLPRHYQNAVFNRLAQTAQADYWGDVFESEDGSHYPKAWSVDLQVVRRRLNEIHGWLAHLDSADHQRVSYPVAEKPAKRLDDLMLAFQNLGQNCEFGLVQRHGGVEPLGILRFSGINLDQLLTTLDNGFEGVGDPENMTVTLVGDETIREYMVSERSIGSYHTFIMENRMDRSELIRRQARHLGFLRRKIGEDLREGGKIWVWRDLIPLSRDRIERLLGALRRYGPNRLLWVTPPADGVPAGTVERLGPDLVRGYATRIDPESGVPGPSWFQVCQDAYRLWHPEDAEADPLAVWR